MPYILALLLLFQAGCVNMPTGLNAVEGFQLQRYLGKWYEIARLDHSFERGLVNVTAEYTLRGDGGINVLNSGYDKRKQKRVSAEGKAYFVGRPDQGSLKVSFFGPFYGSYTIVALDKIHYNYAMVAGPDFNYLWIMSRTPQLDNQVQQQLLSLARRLGFTTDQLIYVPQQP